MDLEGVAPAADGGSETDDGRLFCYRHPDRETWVRCGRCDRPICPRCAMQGPVGFRCRDCGKPVIDPLTSFTTPQLVLGGLLALGAGTVGAMIGLQLGFWSIFVGFFGGGIIADLVMRVTGFKRGPVMVGILVGGIAVGTLIAVGVDYAMLLGPLAAYAGGEDIGFPFLAYLYSSGPWAIVFAGAAIAGAWGRLRY
jgi:hypothetical protein